MSLLQCTETHARGTCGEWTSIRCFTCKQPICAACCEDSWLNGGPETCPSCWDRDERILTPREKDMRLKALLRTLNAIPPEQWDALRTATNEFHRKNTTGIGGAAICICGAGNGGSLACNALKTLTSVKDEAEDLLDVLKWE